MNILIEGMSRQLGGMEAFIMSVYRGLDRESYRMDFIAYDDEIVFEDEGLSCDSTFQKCSSVKKRAGYHF